MLNDATVTANIPAADLSRARDFYAPEAGTPPCRRARRQGVIYRTAGGATFSPYRTEFAGQAGHTIAHWPVDDVAAAVRELQDKGVTFEQYDMPGVDWTDGVASMDDMGKAAWFQDSEGNIVAWTTGSPGD